MVEGFRVVLRDERTGEVTTHMIATGSAWPCDPTEAEVAGKAKASKPTKSAEKPEVKPEDKGAEIPVVPAGDKTADKK